MKKLITLLSLVLLTGYTAKASHAMGGEITVVVDASNVAHLTLTVYRDANPGSATIGSAFTVNIESLSSTSFPTQNVCLSRVLYDTLPSFYATHSAVYTGSVQLPTNELFEVSWSLCCRNNAIVNSIDPSSENLFLKTQFTSYSGSQSSTPVFLNVPAVSFPLDTMWSYNPLPYDADGDHYTGQLIRH